MIIVTINESILVITTNWSPQIIIIPYILSDILFMLGDLIQDPKLHLFIMTFFSRLWQLLRIPLFLVTLTVLRTTGQVFYKIDVDWNFSVVFLITRLCQWILRRKIIETKCHHHHLKSSVHTIDHLSERVFIRFLYCKVIPCLFHNVPLERSV